MEIVKQDKMKRGEFLRSLGLSTSTLMAFYCLGTTMTACGSSDNNEPEPEPNPGGGSATGVTGTTTGNAVNFTIDLTNAGNSDLKKTGGFKTYGDVIVAQTNSSAFVALSKQCTHEGTTIGFRASQNDFLCPTHGSQFSLTGSVEEGPATSALKVFKTTLSTDGNTLTVTA